MTLDRALSRISRRGPTTPRGHRLACRRSLMLAVAVAAIGWLTVGAAPAASKAKTQVRKAAESNAAAMPTFTISRFVLRYLAVHPQLPRIATLDKTPITLGVTAKGFVAPGRGRKNVTRPLDMLTGGKATAFSVAAVQTVLERLRDDLTARHLMGVYVAPDPHDIGPRGADLRPPGRTALHVVITVGRVSEVRTIASGQRISPRHRIDNPLHAWIRQQSPIQPPHDGKPGSLLRKDVLNDYIYLLNRHPGRRVDVALSASAQKAGVDLDYLITENKPWTVYTQISNTGTRQTRKLREQFGFYDTELTNHDDTFSLDYLTAGFRTVHAVSASYEAPVNDHNQRLRWGVHLRWGQYTASDVGFFNDTFRGKTWDGGAQLIDNIYQKNNFFLDALAGARYEWVNVSNTLPGSSPGAEGFVLPHVGMQAAMRSQWYHFNGKGVFELANGNWTGVSSSAEDNLGRPGIDKSWQDFRWNLNYSVFLEPLLDWKNWSDPTTPGSSTLAHELSLSFRGQYAFGNRLIPQEEGVAGGMYSVRGYPESAVAGDDVEIFRAEYRFHVPRIFSVRAKAGALFGQPFRFAPQYVYGMPDWDLALKTFLDVGHVSSNAGNAAAEAPASLVGAGVGFDTVVKRNLRFTLDWGFALKAIPGQVGAGSSRVHFALTLLY